MIDKLYVNYKKIQWHKDKRKIVCNISFTFILINYVFVTISNPKRLHQIRKSSSPLGLLLGYILG